MAGGAARLTALAVVLGGLVGALALSGSLSADSVHDEVDRAGAWAPVVFVIAGSLLSVMLFPAPFTASASGLLFGTAAGTPITIVTLVCGGTLTFSISRWWAHDAVQDIASRRPRLRALRRWVGERGFLSVLYARIAPGVPFNLVSYAAGLAPVRLQAFIAATALGCAPRAFAYTALGGSFGDFGSPEALIAIAVLVAMALGGLLIAASARSRGSRAGPGSGTGSSTPAARSAAPR